MTNIYLDYAAATPIEEKVLAAMQPYFSEKFHNPSAIYLAAKEARLALEMARANIAKWLGARPAEIIFTSGATEANNLAISGIMSRFPGAEILTSAIEHDSVLAPAKQYRRRLIPVRPDGIVDLAKLEKMISAKTALVSVMMVNNEIGTIQPVRKIGQILNKLSKKRQTNQPPLYLHTDAAQAGNFFDLHTARLGVDMMSLNGGKVYGPKQTGLLYVRGGVELKPLILGGGQERGLRSGTENIAGAVGLATALDLAQSQRHNQATRSGQLRGLFIKELNAELPSAVVNGSSKHQAPHLISVSLPGHDNERLIMELDEAGIQAAAGSACSASDEQSSHVLKSIGLSEAIARSTLRFSLGRQTTAANTKKTVKILKKLTDSAT